MNNKILVSVIIPCYNVEDYINECIESVLVQEYFPIEIICIDNNSSDNTLEILERLSERNENLQVFEEKQKGASKARNLGLKICKGNWVQFLDADDLLLPTKIHHQIQLIEKHQKELSFIASSYKSLNKWGKQIPQQINLNVWKGLFISQLGYTSSNLFKKETLLEVGGWDGKLSSSQEYDLMFRLLKVNSNIIFDNTPLTIKRERETGQISHSEGAKNWKNFLKVRLDIWNYLKANRNKYFIEIKFQFSSFLSNVLLKAENVDSSYAYKMIPEFFGEKFFFIGYFSKPLQLRILKGYFSIMKRIN